MLELHSKSISVNGVTAFPDHADPKILWYLPSQVRLAKDPDTGAPKFTLIKFREEVNDAGVEGGGYLMFEVDLSLDEDTRRELISKGSQLTSGTPILSPVIFDEGTVECVALNLQGGGGTSADDEPPGAFIAVEEILGASIPLQTPDYKAIFSLTLSKNGAIILEQAFEQGAAPVGVVYKYLYTGLRPAVDVTITADFERIYDHFSAKLEGQYYFVKASLEAGFEKLKQEGVIEIKVNNFVPSSEKNDAEEMAIKLFKEELLSKWFEPTLSLGTLQGTSSGGSSILGQASDVVSDAISAGRNNNGSSSGGSSGSGSGSGGSSGSGSGSGSGGRQGSGSGGGSTSTPQQGPRQAATLTLQPPSTPGYSVTMTPSTEGEEETLTITGGRNLRISVGNEQKQRNAQNQVKVNVPHGQRVEVVIEDPAVTEQTATFKLLFSEDRPGASANRQTISNFARNAPRPNDAIFKSSVSPDTSCAPLTGADGLRQWITACLPAPKTIKSVTAHASWDSTGNHNIQPPETAAQRHDLTTNLAVHNQRLSEKRLDIATEIIGSLATFSSATATGDQRGRRDGINDRDSDRVVEIEGVTQHPTGGVRIVATVARPARPSVEQPTPTPEKPKKNTPKEGIAGDPAIAFRLKYIRQEERKKLTLRYNRADAVQRQHNPQGFFGLLLQGLDKSKHFIEVDLNDPFFRDINIRAEAPIDYDHIGLHSVDLGFEYEEEGKDLVFDENSPVDQSIKYALSADDPNNLAYHLTKQYHFDPLSGWEGEKTSYEFANITTEDRTLHVNPFVELGFLSISVEPTFIDWKGLNMIEVFLRYDDVDSGFKLDKHLVFTEQESDPQIWKLRLSDRDARSYTFRIVHHLKDGSRIETEPETTEVTRLALNDPFDFALDIDVVPLFTPGAIRFAILDIEYHDEENNYHRTERIQVNGDQTQPIRVRLSIINPELREYTHQVTFVGTNNSLEKAEPVTTSETIIPLSPTL